MLIVGGCIQGVKARVHTLKSPHSGLSNDPKITLIGEELSTIGLIAICPFLI
jgi:hypothetical protein